MMLNCEQPFNLNKSLGHKCDGECENHLALPTHATAVFAEMTLLN